MIVDGKIKLKSGSGGIKKFTEDSLIAEDGSELKADVVLCMPVTRLSMIIGEAS